MHIYPTRNSMMASGVKYCVFMGGYLKVALLPFTHKTKKEKHERWRRDGVKITLTLRKKIMFNVIHGRATNIEWQNCFLALRNDVIICTCMTR